MLTIVGTIPVSGLGLTEGKAILRDFNLAIDGLELVPSLGTSAMVSAAAITCEALGCEPPLVVIIGDIGDGKGSRELYKYLMFRLPELNPTVLAMHYIMPYTAEMRKVIDAIRTQKEEMTILADAGSRYAAKAAGLAGEFDIFTPDSGEMAYLADPDASHPAYVQHLLFEIDTSETINLINKAYEHNNITKVLLVKGVVDYIAEGGRIVKTVEEPVIPVMESIGGTGDVLIGILSALIHAGYEKVDACIKAAKVNRIAGKIARPAPATPVSEIIAKIPDALKMVGTGSTCDYGLNKERS